MIWRKSLVFFLAFTALAGAARVSPKPDAMSPLFQGEFAFQQGDLASAARWYLAAAQASGDPALAERAAHIALLAGDNQSAGLALARWRALAPSAPQLHSVSIGLALRQGEVEQALAEVRPLLAQSGDEGWRLVLTSLAEAQGDAAVSARGVLRELLDQGGMPASVDAWLAFAGLARRLGDRPLSDQIVAAMVNGFPRDPRAQLIAASRLREQGDRAGARRAIDRVVASNRLDPDQRRAAAGELAALDDPLAAAQLLASGVQDDDSYARRTIWLAQAGDTAALNALYAEVKADSPQPNPERRLLLGQVAEAASLWKDAEQWYLSVVAGPARDRAQLRLPVVLGKQGRAADAIAALHRYQGDEQADGESVRDSYLLEAELLEQRGGDYPSQAAYDRGLKIYENDPVLLYGRALHEERFDRVEAALADLKRILADDPDNAEALNAYGYTLADRRQRYAEALPYIDKANRLRPGNAAVLDSLGWVRLKLGQGKDALPLLRMAWSLQQDADVAAHLGEALWLTGSKGEARQIWQAGLKLDADNRSLKRMRETYRP